MNIIPIFPPLYILHHTNKTYLWQIRIIANTDSTYSIVTEHGLIDGKKVIHTRVIVKGKGKRSILEQCIQEAQRKWLDKKEKELYVESLKQIKPEENNEIYHGTVRPMLAKTFSFDKYTEKTRSFKISFPAYIQRKYDGIRCLASIQKNKVLLESRKGNIFEHFPKIKQELSSILKDFPSGFYFDGELYTDELPFEVISGMIHLTSTTCTPEEVQKMNKIHYYIYDIIDTNHINRTYQERFQLLTTMFIESYTNLFYINMVETIWIPTVEDVQKYHDLFVKEGKEGIILRDPMGIYEVNKRSKYLQKYKEFMEDEFEIVGFHEEMKDEKGAIIWECITKHGNIFSARPKGTFESRVELTKHGNQYIGQKLTVIFQGYTEENIPRFPVAKAIRDIY